MKFDNKTIWIIGATSKVGKTLTYQISKSENIQLIISSRNKNDLVNVIKKTKLNDSNYLILPFDLQNQKNIPKVINNILDKFTKIDIFINASNTYQNMPFIKTKDDILKKTMDINYFSQVNILRKLIPIMIGEGGGTIINVSDIFANFGKSQLSVYSASKHALEGLYKSLNDEFKNKIDFMIIYYNKNISSKKLNKIAQHIKKQKQHIYLSCKDYMLIKLLFLKKFSFRLFNKFYKN